MKKLNWTGFLLLLILCTLAGGSNKSIPIFYGLVFGFILGALFGLFPLIEGRDRG